MLQVRIGRLPRVGLAALGVLALLALALLAPAARARPAPPTPAELERATERFLADREAKARAGPSTEPPPAPAPAPLPDNRVLALYGAPQLTRTIVGSKSPPAAARKLVRQSAAYEGDGLRPVIPAFDLVAVIATAGAGADGKYRSRQDEAVIATYLEQARAVGARLILDIQPGRSTFRTELRALRPWLLQPDVDVALDPEWNVGRRGVPGRTAGSVGARTVNRVARSLSQTIAASGLPPKLLLVHQFRKGSIRGRGRIAAPPGVQAVLNYDGIGIPRAKQAGYAELSTPDLFNGFSLFYRLDEPLMQTDAVLGLVPEPDFLLYQ